MTGYTVEAVAAPVVDSDWSPLRRIIDLVPGTILLEDPEEPMLVIPVEAETPSMAFLFVDGVAKLASIELRAGNVYPAPEVDFDYDEDDDASFTQGTDVTRTVEGWIDSIPPLHGHVSHDGDVVPA